MVMEFYEKTACEFNIEFNPFPELTAGYRYGASRHMNEENTTIVDARVPDDSVVVNSSGVKYTDTFVDTMNEALDLCKDFDVLMVHIITARDAFWTKFFAVSLCYFLEQRGVAALVCIEEDTTGQSVLYTKKIITNLPDDLRPDLEKRYSEFVRMRNELFEEPCAD